MNEINSSIKELLDRFRNIENPIKGLEKIAADLIDQIEEIVKWNRLGEIESDLLRDYLHITGCPGFLTSIKKREDRYRWTDGVLEIIRHLNYNLLDMFRYRVESHPNKTLFRDMTPEIPLNWSYKVTYNNIRAIAALFHKIEDKPRVAVYSSNQVESAWTDLACLCYDILVTPLNVHFDEKILIHIFDLLGINIVVTDTPKNYEHLTHIQGKVKQDFRIFTLNPNPKSEAETELIPQALAANSSSEIEQILKDRPRFKLTEVCTVMFTSGSTGQPKGISFSQYNLITKRFARAAALPAVGNDEVLLCYLPLYHTFGRYFEMLGSIYWHGTYIFPGNTSVETLLTLLHEINPTGLISVPVRWVQIQERCLEKMETMKTSDLKAKVVREIIGHRMHWGLSAAGYLSPKIFKFFNKHGVKLCSGFGMTEATGGITMTPPGEYVENSIGIPLPGVDVKINEQGEMMIAGAYIAHYYDDKGIGDEIPIEYDDDRKYWLKTGDLFRKIDKGHYEIVDRLKDIYKNNKGQTIAPQKVEKKFEGVPGIRRTFLVGDAREYNVLLIVPDNDDPVIHGLPGDESLREYFHQIVSNANQDLATYERVVNFEILKRDFTIDKDELTPKGSYKRKNIEANFKQVIERLYRKNYVELKLKDLTVQIPRWIYRDIGNLEDVIEITKDGLINRINKKSLKLKRNRRNKRIRIGNLEYIVDGDIIDLGTMAKQPSLWMGNPDLINFCPCREGWDLPAKKFSRRVFLPEDAISSESRLPDGGQLLVRDQMLSVVNQLIARALFGEPERSVGAIEKLGFTLDEADDRIKRVIRWRLETLAVHPDFKVRATAYRVLLLDEPTPNYDRVFPAFIDSGLPFLDEESIRKIAHSDLKKRRLEALRLRLFSYRTQFKWPASKAFRQQFISIFKLLCNFAEFHPEYYDMVRCELASWILLKSDRALSKAAEESLTTLYTDYENNLKKTAKKFTDGEWESKIVFGDELTEQEKKRLREVLVGTTFLKQSITLGFDDNDFDLDKVPQGGIWISRILSRRRNQRYRVSVNAISGKHYDLQIILNWDVTKRSVLETIYWLMSLSSYPYGTRILPRLGCVRLELGARSLVYHGDLTVWEKIREFTSYQYSPPFTGNDGNWRKLYLRSLAIFFRGWRISGYKIVPGAVTPENVVVPNQDFREGAMIESITGWRKYENTLSLIRPIVQNFYRKTISHYPSSLDIVDINWIFDACIIELGFDQGKEFLTQLQVDLQSDPLPFDSCRIARELDTYMVRIETEYVVPLALQSAIDRYNEWVKVNPQATSLAKEQIITELIRLYRLDRLDELAHYYLYRHTYFMEASKKTRKAFDELLQTMFKNRTESAIQLVELSDLQATLDNKEDRDLFGHMIFPKAKKPQQVEIFAVGDSAHKHVVVKTVINDEYGESYTIREPIEPAEIGRLYRLFFKEGYPKTVTERDRFLLVIDSQDQVIGGLCYRHDGDDIVHLDGSVITGLMMGRGIGGALLEDFCSRMSSQGTRIVKTHFFLRNFYTKHGFTVDTRWGALVRFLNPEKFIE